MHCMALQREGAAMNAYTELMITQLSTMRQIWYPDYVLVIDPALAFTDNITKMISLPPSISLQLTMEEG